MTAAAAIDPAAVVAAAGREFVEALRDLVGRDAEDVPGLLDEVSRLLRRARGRVARATKVVEPAVPATARPPASAPQPGRAVDETTASRTATAPDGLAAPQPLRVLIPAARPVAAAIRPAGAAPRHAAVTLPTLRATPRSAITKRFGQGVPMYQQNYSPPPGRRGPSSFVVALLVAGAMLAAIVVIVLIGALANGGDSSQQRGSDAVEQCQQAVKDRLKSPASAQFGDPSLSVATGETADFYTVTGTVDSQNSFGAMLRNQYRCKATLERDGKWRVDLTMSRR